MDRKKGASGIFRTINNKRANIGIIDRKELGLQEYSKK